jgi:hypothetical protein
MGDADGVESRPNFSDERLGFWYSMIKVSPALCLNGGMKMKCPHCLNSYHPQVSGVQLGSDEDHSYIVNHQICPSCKKIIIELRIHNRGFGSFISSSLVYPKSVSRAPLSKHVQDEYADDYKEACLVYSDSPKASAALSRRCLQNVLRAKAGVKPSNLSQEIDEVLRLKQLPSHLAEGIDAVRNIGNFAAHPIKSTNTGEIVDVEPGEAEWLLDILEGLFDFYFVQPAILKRKREALNAKLADAGKAPLK